MSRSKNSKIFRNFVQIIPHLKYVQIQNEQNQKQFLTKHEQKCFRKSDSGEWRRRRFKPLKNGFGSN